MPDSVEAREKELREIPPRKRIRALGLPASAVWASTRWTLLALMAVGWSTGTASRFNSGRRSNCASGSLACRLAQRQARCSRYRCHVPIHSSRDQSPAGAWLGRVLTITWTGKASTHICCRAENGKIALRESLAAHDPNRPWFRANCSAAIVSLPQGESWYPARQRRDRMRRWESISFLGSTAIAWVLAAYARQPAMPVIGSSRGDRSTSVAHKIRNTTF